MPLPKVIANFVFVETEKSVVSEFTYLDHAGETARGTFSLAKLLMHIFGRWFATKKHKKHISENQTERSKENRFMCFLCLFVAK